MTELWAAACPVRHRSRAYAETGPEIGVSWLHGSREILNSLYAEAVGFLPKSVGVEEVADAIRRSQQGESPELKEQLEGLLKSLEEKDERATLLWDRLKKLNRRELQILAFINSGSPLNEIATRLEIAPRTVRNYLDSMLKKAGARSQIELLAIAKECGPIDG